MVAPTVMESAYAAGIFDGEGTIDMKDRVRMAVKMTDIEPVKAMWNILGGHFYQWRDTQTGRPVYEWRAAGWAGVIEAIEAIIPFSRGKRRQLEVVANFNAYRERYGLIASAKDAAAFQLRSLRMPTPQPITFDIESMGLDPNTLLMLSCTFLEGDNESGVYTTYKMTPPSDRDLVVQVREILEAAPYTIGFNSERFDINYINTRLIANGERPMFLGSHDDASVMYDALFNNKKRTSLANAAAHMGVTDDKEAKKTPIDWPIWHAANAGDEDAMQYVINHGMGDVILTKRLYNAIT